MRRRHSYVTCWVPVLTGGLGVRGDSGFSRCCWSSSCTDLPPRAAVFLSACTTCKAWEVFQICSLCTRGVFGLCTPCGTSSQRVFCVAPAASLACRDVCAWCACQLVDGVTFLYVKRSGLFFILTTKFNVSPSLSIELLDRCTKVFKVRGVVFWQCVAGAVAASPAPHAYGHCDHFLIAIASSPIVAIGLLQDYCGVLTEESIRKNFILIYELLDEMIVRASS
jgi:hypothetical protein